MKSKKQEKKENLEKKNSIFKKVWGFLKKNKKILFVILIVLCIIFALVFGLYKFFFNSTNDKLYENFRIVNVETKEKQNRKIANSSTFFIETDEKVNVESVKQHIYISPSIDYEIKKINSKKYELIPTDELVDNQVYSIEEVQNETPVYKWAFETERKLSVRDHTEYLSKNEPIKISFSMDNVEDINDYVTISPYVKGTWKKYNSYWVFETKVKLNTDYTVTISNELKAGEYKLEGGYSFTVYSYNNENSNEDTIDLYKYTKDGIHTFTSKDRVKTVISLNGYEKIDNQDISVNVFKFNNISDFKKSIKGEKTLDISKLEKTYSAKEKIENSVVTLSKSLNNGYYIIEYNYNRKKVYQYVQITDVQAYQITTERDLIVWTIKNGKVTSGIEVEFNGKKVKSNKDGIAKFENINPGNLKDEFITVDNTSKNPVVILTTNFNKDNYPNGYVYTDRPLYKADDTINIWGCVSVSDFIDKIEDKFTIQYGNSKKKVKVNEDGTFTTSIKLNNHVDDEYFEIGLYYKDTYIASRSISIYNYTKPTYTYEIKMNKHVYYAGDTIEFDVYVEHMTGLTAKDKKVKVSFNSSKYSAITNDLGIAHFKIKTSYDKENTSLYDWSQIQVYTGDDEEDYDNFQAIEEVVIYNQNIYIDANSSGKNGDYNLNIKANKIDFNKTEEEFYYTPALGDKYNEEATIKIYKETVERAVVGTYYDDIEGEMVDDIEWNRYEELVDTRKVTLKNGKAELKNLKYESSSTEDKDISYYATIEIKDTNKRVAEETVYFYYNEGSYYDDADYDRLYNDIEDFYSEGVHNYALITDVEKKAVEGETIRYHIIDRKGNKVDINGKLLTVFYKEKIVDSNIKTNNNLSFKFNKQYVPGIYVAAAYLKDGKVYSVASSYVDYDEKEKETKIVIKTNKEEYKPGEEVEATIKVVDKDGKAIKTNVNLSVVDKAIFEIAEDTTDILNSIYLNRYYSMYQSATDRDYYYVAGGGIGSTGGDSARYNFKDTAFFKTVSTDKNGEAKFKFTLPDNITSYRLTAHSANKDGYVGVNTSHISVVEDFFVESPIPQGVKYTDDLVINAISHGKKATGEVDYTFEINGQKQKAKAKVDEYVSVNFKTLPVGEYDLKITGKCGEYTDSIINKITIVGNTQEVPVKTTTDIDEKTEIKATKNPITLEIYDKKLDTYLTYINYLESYYSSRLDKRLGLYEADRLSQKFYGNNEFSYGDLSEYLYEDTDLVRTKPNGKSQDVLLSAVVREYASRYFHSYYDNGFTSVLMNEKTKSRDYYAAILGLASKGEITLSDLDYLKDNDKERDNFEYMILAAAYGFLGDYDTAKKMYKEFNVEVKDNAVYIKNNAIENDDVSAILAILASMTNKNDASKIIDSLIAKKSTTMYLNFAIIAYLENNTEIIESKKEVTIRYGKESKTISISGFHVEKIDIDNKDVKTLKFIDASSNLKVSYYYATGIDEISSNTIKKDVTATISKEIKKNSDVKLNIKYKNNSKEYMDLRIAIPNGLSIDLESMSLGDDIYVKSYKPTYVTLSISPEVKTVNIKIPFTAVNEGKYVFEPVVILDNGVYHISSKNIINIKK